MSSVIQLAQEQLDLGGYAVALGGDTEGQIITFENASILGFVICFPDPAALIDRWRSASERALKAAQFALRRADAKSWNAYVVLLAEAPGDYGQNIALGAIEEDLVGTRKIARAGIATSEDARAALLPLLEIQNAPQLEAVDMAAEIKLRTSELPTELVEAFLSEAADSTLIQLLEAGQ